MKLAIITSRYPSKNAPYNHMFVHARSLYFNKQEDISLTVFVPSKKEEKYVYEGVEVLKKPSYDIAQDIKNYDIIYIHLLNIYLDTKVSGEHIYQSIVDNNIPVAIYLHGSEVQKYGTRSFDFDFSIREIAKYFYKDFYFIPKIRKFIRIINKRDNSIFIAPSKWMIKEAEKNLSTSLNHYKVIPNGIDTDLFKFNDLFQNTNKIITLRPLESPKYAVDVAIEIMRHLPKEFTLDIFGKGKLENEYRYLIKSYNLEERVHIINKFIDRNDMNDLFLNYGIALMPTRMDAQGVSMCEMMSSGLLTISSYSTAIPEFITDKKNGILGENDRPKGISNKIIEAVDNEHLYRDITKNARIEIEKIDIDKVMKREMNELIKII